MEITIKLTEEQSAKIARLNEEIMEDQLKSTLFEPKVTERGWWIFKTKSYDWSGRPDLKHCYWEPSPFGGSLYAIKKPLASFILRISDCAALSDEVTLSHEEADMFAAIMQENN